MNLGDSVICIAPVRGLIEGKVYRIVEFDQNHVNLLVCQPEWLGCTLRADTVLVWGSRFAFTDFADYIKPTFFADVAVRIKPTPEPVKRACSTCAHSNDSGEFEPCRTCLEGTVDLPNWKQGS
jgi:hypothetical protein